jgi:hypothetical protein
MAIRVSETHEICIMFIKDCRTLTYVSWFSYRVCLILKIHENMSSKSKGILIYIQQDATLLALFYLETAQHISDDTPPTAHSNQFQLFHDSGR